MRSFICAHCTAVGTQAERARSAKVHARQSDLVEGMTGAPAPAYGERTGQVSGEG